LMKSTPQSFRVPIRTKDRLICSPSCEAKYRIHSE